MYVENRDRISINKTYCFCPLISMIGIPSMLKTKSFASSSFIFRLNSIRLSYYIQIKNVMVRGRENRSILTFKKKRNDITPKWDVMMSYATAWKKVTYLRYTFAISESCSSTIKAVACLAFKDDCHATDCLKRTLDQNLNAWVVLMCSTLLITYQWSK